MTFFKFLITKEFLKQLLFAGLALVVLIFLLLWWLRITTNHSQKIKVPDLAKLSIDKVEDVLNKLELRYEVLDSANFNPGYPRFTIIEQIPKPGKFVKEDRKIYLTINPSGFRKIKVPEVLGITARQAKPTLLATGFQIGHLSTRPHISDHVLEMRYKGEEITPGSEIPKTSVIDLIVGDGTKSRVQRESDNEENSTEKEID
ncbi:MAG: beta-lactam-binding protein with PASTA domain [Sediminicola sp.]|jgi:beta-lactam-binding protein with PASTA domain|tara:strand:- start:3651 stop:4256 length:606 start_codon:yes stop_codon:yes gene_type:complete